MNNRIAALLPILEWLPAYRRDWLRADLVAGLTLAAFMLPESLAYGSLAGLPPQAGLYATMLAGFAFALFCSGRHTVIAVTSAISLLLAAELGPMAAGDPQRYWWLASLTALYVGVIALIAHAAKAGSVVGFVSDTILAGFKMGVALQIAVSQLPKLFGVEGGHGSFFAKAATLAGNLGSTHWPSLAVGGGAIVLILAGERLFRHKPVELMVMVLAIVLMTFTGLGAFGIHVLGDLPSGMPDLGPPPLRGRDVDGLLALALACFLLATVETNAVSRTFGLKHGYRTDANQDFLAIGASNLLVGVAQGYPVSGGMSQSAVNDAAGARTPLSLVIAGLILCLIAVFFSAQFRNLPEPLLAAVVLVAIRGLVKTAAFKELYRFSRAEFAVALVALSAVLAFGVLKGVLLAAAFSLMLLLQRAMHPTLALLGRRPGADGFSELRHDPRAESLPGTVIVKPYGALLYFNADAVRQRLYEIIGVSERPRFVVLALGVVPIVDLAGTKLLRDLRDELAGRGIALSLAEVNDTVFDNLRTLGFDRELLVAAPHEALGEVIARFRQTT